jgi:hypothetical protein
VLNRERKREAFEEERFIFPKLRSGRRKDIIVILYQLI